MAPLAKSHENCHPLGTPSTPGPATSSHACAGRPAGVSRGDELTQEPFFQARVRLPSELYEYCSKAVPFISASFQGAPNLLHIRFHLTIPLNYLNSPSRKRSPSIIAPSSAAHVEFGDLQIHLISPRSCRAAGFRRLPSPLPSRLTRGHVCRGLGPKNLRAKAEHRCFALGSWVPRCFLT